MRSIHSLVLALGASVVFAGASLADTEVEVSFSDGLQKYISRIDRVESKREALFREYRDDTIVGRARSERRFATTYYRDVRWASEQLIADAEDYGVEAVVSALVREGLKRAGIPDGNSLVRVHIKRMKISNHSVARLSGVSSYVTGTFALVDSSTGQTIRGADISANLVVSPTVDNSYQGDDWAYPDVDSENRVGPALAYFVMKGLEKLYPESKFPKPISISYITTSSGN